MAGGDAGKMAGRVPEQPKSYLVPSIFAMLACCPPTGLVAVIKAAGVGSAYTDGNFERAAELSASAKLWLWVTVLLGVPVWLMIFFGVGAVGTEIFS